MAAPHNPNPLGPKADKEWRDAIRLAVHGIRQAKDSDGKTKKVKALRLIAEKLVDCAIAGDITAIKELGDRLDGKSPQYIEGSMEHRHLASELTDDELARIAAGSGRGTAKKTNGSGPPDTVH